MQGIDLVYNYARRHNLTAAARELAKLNVINSEWIEKLIVELSIWEASTIVSIAFNEIKQPQELEEYEDESL